MTDRAPRCTLEGVGARELRSLIRRFTLPVRRLAPGTSQQVGSAAIAFGVYSLGRKEEGTVISNDALMMYRNGGLWDPRSFHPRGRHICRWWRLP